MKYTKISAIALIAALLNPIAKADLVDQFNAARARTTDAVETQTCINQTAPIFFDLGKQVIKSYVAEAAALFGSVYDSEQGSPETRNFMWYSVFKLRDGTLCSLDMENNLKGLYG